MDFNLSEKDMAVYDLLIQYLTEKKGCSNLLLGLIYPPKIYQLGELLGKIKASALMPDLYTTQQTINAVLAIGMSSKSFEDLTRQLQSGIKSGTSTRSRIGNTQKNIIEFSIVVSLAYWKVMRETIVH